MFGDVLQIWFGVIMPRLGGPKLGLEDPQTRPGVLKPRLGGPKVGFEEPEIGLKHNICMWRLMPTANDS